VDCDGSNAVIMSQTECAIPVQTMKDAPYSHPWGASIQAYIVAINAYGISAPSERANGAIIMTVPDAPLYFREDVQHRSATQIGVEWQTPLNFGGSDVIDYRVFSDQGSDSWVVLEANIMLTQAILSPLVAGQIYKFKAQARNQYGYSADSEVLSILAADRPSQVAQPTTSVVNNNVLV
jgi:hypothetical protein